MNPKKISMSELATFQRCEKKFYYSEVLGLKSRAPVDNISFGTLFHQAMQAGYRQLKGWPLGEPLDMRSAEFLGMAHAAILRILSEGAYYRRGKREPFALTDEKLGPLCHDAVDFYWEHQGKLDVFDEIISVEVPVEFQLGDYTISNTFDLLVRQDGRLKLIDHKTSGAINEAYEFLDRDFQVLCYPLAAWKVYGELVEVVYNLVRRGVPPNFQRPDGTKPYELTKSGAKSKASTDLDDYLKRVSIFKSIGQLEHFEKMLAWQIRGIADCTADAYWPVRPIQTGGQACKGCPFVAPCTAEIAGNVLDRGALALTYDFKE